MAYNPDLEIQQDFPLKDKLIKKGFWLYFFAFLTAPTGYIIKLIGARTMGVEDVGLFYSILGLIGIVASYNDLGLTESLQYFLPRYLINKDYVKAKSLLVTTWVIQFVSGIIVGGTLRIMAPWLAEHYFQSSQAIIVLRRFCLYFLVVNLFQVMQSLFLATQDTKASNSIDATRMWIVVGVLILIWQIDTLTVNIITLTYSWIIGLIIGIGIAGVLFWRRFGQMMREYSMIWDKGLVCEWVGYAWWVFWGTNISTLFGQIDLQFALYFLGKEAAGYWTTYSSLIAGVYLITGPLASYLFPLVNELMVKGEQHKLQLLMRYIGFGLLGGVVIIGGGAYLLGPWVAVALFGEGFRYSGELLRFAAPFIMLSPMVSFGFQYLAGVGMVKQRVKILCVGLLTHIIFSYLLIRFYDFKGLVISTAISYFVLGFGVIYYIYSSKSELSDSYGGSKF